MLLHICLLPTHVLAQTGEYDVKAVFLWRIAQYIEWPAKSNLETKTEPFIIAVLGKNPFGTILDDVYASGDRKIKNRVVDVQYISKIDQITGCDILFISNSEEKRIEKIQAYTKGKSILMVGDTQNYGEKGIHFNFYVAENKIRFELNESSAKVDGFIINYRLRNIAKIVGSKKGGTK